ncbi:MAG: DNA recombination protein RmuC [Enterobacterales bacterium]|nr:DNA recombination protein RmuC [Enterobacterales bacterium]
MLDFLAQNQSFLVGVNLLILIVILALFLFLGQKNQSKNIIEDNQQQTNFIQLAIKESQKNLDEKLNRLQIQLIESLSQDREKQIQQIGELKLNLEQRFATSEKGLSTNISSFKQEMIEKFEHLKRDSSLSLQQGHEQITLTVNNFGEKINTQLQTHQKSSSESITENIRKGINELRQDLDRSLKQQNERITNSLSGLTDSTDKRLKEISGQVEKRLAEGFDKTNQTFTDVLKRLALIDDAQKKITELSTNVMSLQEILNDKRSRGAFGEVQLQSLVSNIMPDSHYTMQHTLSNGKIADCVLIMPEPTGSIAIDAKFPLESYKKMTDVSLAVSDRKDASKQFSRDIKKHINDISDKYVLPPETSDGAVMFIPAESVFAEIHGHYPELVEYAYQKKVWLVSPTTLMAILTTASAVIKDQQTRKQVHIIKEHLSALGKNFVRFQERMDKLSKHIGLVSKDVESVHTSAKKISSHFDRIERVELSKEPLQGDDLLKDESKINELTEFEAQG